jgi:ComF family protein
MRRHFYMLVSHILSFVTTPRPSEEVVSSLTLPQLFELGGHTGVLPYHDTRVKALVWELKYYRHPHALELAGAVLAEQMVGMASESLGVPLLIPVPMYTARRRARGHNQTEVLCAAALVHARGFVQYEPRALVRTRNTPSQQGLPKHLRLYNVEGSMSAPNTELVRGRTCLVVDDVTTTGATLAEAARALRQAGAAEVLCLALARS